MCQFEESDSVRRLEIAEELPGIGDPNKKHIRFYRATFENREVQIAIKRYDHETSYATDSLQQEYEGIQACRMVQPAISCSKLLIDKPVLAKFSDSDYFEEVLIFEMISGNHMGASDIQDAKQLIRRVVFEAKIWHRDTDRVNFVTDDKGKVHIIDFAQSIKIPDGLPDSTLELIYRSEVNYLLQQMRNRGVISDEYFDEIITETRYDAQAIAILEALKAELKNT